MFLVIPRLTFFFFHYANWGENESSCESRGTSQNDNPNNGTEEKKSSTLTCSSLKVSPLWTWIQLLCSKQVMTKMKQKTFTSRARALFVCWFKWHEAWVNFFFFFFILTLHTKCASQNASFEWFSERELLITEAMQSCIKKARFDKRKITYELAYEIIGVFSFYWACDLSVNIKLHTPESAHVMWSLSRELRCF